jgi:membrane protease YdiL (CAAX protease family)
VPLPDAPSQKVWKFWGTALWGALIFAAMFAGQFALVACFLVLKGPPFDLASMRTVAGSGTVISLSVMMGLPAVLAVLWLATRLSGTPFVDYLALRRTSWSNLLIGIVALAVLVVGWDVVSRAIGREVAPGFMVDVLKSAQADGALWLLVIAFSVAAPATEELMVRGFLYRGWSQSFLGPVGAIVLSSLVWTAMHAQYYDWFLFSEVMSIGLVLGIMRWRSNSTWLTIIMHGLNNFAATLQTIWLAGQ